MTSSMDSWPSETNWPAFIQLLPTLPKHAAATATYLKNGRGNFGCGEFHTLNGLKEAQAEEIWARLETCMGSVISDTAGRRDVCTCG